MGENEIDTLIKKIIGAAYTVHNALGADSWRKCTRTH